MCMCFNEDDGDNDHDILVGSVCSPQFYLNLNFLLSHISFIWNSFQMTTYVVFTFYILKYVFVLHYRSFMVTVELILRWLIPLKFALWPIYHLS